MEKNKSREQSTRSDVVRQLKAVRKEQHITQEVLAERAGTKKSNISRLESGRYNPSLDFLVWTNRRRQGIIMKKNKPKTMGKNIDRDVELCRTTNARVSSQMMRTLVSHEIPFTRNWVRVPFYKRVAYNGAKEVCVISTHYNQYQRARRVLDHMEVVYRERMILHAV